jgi:hypothetical protein
MNTQYINKLNDDLIVAIDLECCTGHFNIEDFENIYFYVYTTDNEKNIECYYDHSLTPTTHNLDIKKDGSFLHIEQSDLKELKNGELKVRIEYAVVDSTFADGLFNGSEFLSLNAYLTDTYDVYKPNNFNPCI